MDILFIKNSDKFLKKELLGLNKSFYDVSPINWNDPKRKELIGQYLKSTVIKDNDFLNHEKNDQDLLLKIQEVQNNIDLSISERTSFLLSEIEKIETDLKSLQNETSIDDVSIKEELEKKELRLNELKEQLKEIYSNIEVESTEKNDSNNNDQEKLKEVSIENKTKWFNLSLGLFNNKGAANIVLKNIYSTGFDSLPNEDKISSLSEIILDYVTNPINNIDVSNFSSEEKIKEIAVNILKEKNVLKEQKDLNIKENGDDRIIPNITPEEQEALLKDLNLDINNEVLDSDLEDVIAKGIEARRLENPTRQKILDLNREIINSSGFINVKKIKQSFAFTETKNTEKIISQSSDMLSEKSNDLLSNIKKQIESLKNKNIEIDLDLQDVNSINKFLLNIEDSNTTNSIGNIGGVSGFLKNIKDNFSKSILRLKGDEYAILSKSLKDLLNNINQRVRLDILEEDYIKQKNSIQELEKASSDDNFSKIQEALLKDSESIKTLASRFRKAFANNDTSSISSILEEHDNLTKDLRDRFKSAEESGDIEELNKINIKLKLLSLEESCLDLEFNSKINKFIRVLENNPLIKKLVTYPAAFAMGVIGAPWAISLTSNALGAATQLNKHKKLDVEDLTIDNIKAINPEKQNILCSQFFACISRGLGEDDILDYKQKLEFFKDISSNKNLNKNISEAISSHRKDDALDLAKKTGIRFATLYATTLVGKTLSESIGLSDLVKDGINNMRGSISSVVGLDNKQLVLESIDSLSSYNENNINSESINSYTIEDLEAPANIVNPVRLTPSSDPDFFIKMSNSKNDIDEFFSAIAKKYSSNEMAHALIGGRSESTYGLIRNNLDNYIYTDEAGDKYIDFTKINEFAENNKDLLGKTYSNVLNHPEWMNGQVQNDMQNNIESDLAERTRGTIYEGMDQETITILQRDVQSVLARNDFNLAFSNNLEYMQKNGLGVEGYNQRVSSIIEEVTKTELGQKYMMDAYGINYLDRTTWGLFTIPKFDPKAILDEYLNTLPELTANRKLEIFNSLNSIIESSKSYEEAQFRFMNFFDQNYKGDINLDNLNEYQINEYNTLREIFNRMQSNKEYFINKIAPADEKLSNFYDVFGKEDLIAAYRSRKPFNVFYRENFPSADIYSDDVSSSYNEYLQQYERITGIKAQAQEDFVNNQEIQNNNLVDNNSEYEDSSNMDDQTNDIVDDTEEDEDGLEDVASQDDENIENNQNTESDDVANNNSDNVENHTTTTPEIDKEISAIRERVASETNLDSNTSIANRRELNNITFLKESGVTDAEYILYKKMSLIESEISRLSDKAYSPINPEEIRDQASYQQLLQKQQELESIKIQITDQRLQYIDLVEKRAKVKFLEDEISRARESNNRFQLNILERQLATAKADLPQQ